MRLNNALVTSFLYEGKEYDIDLAYDNVLDVFDVLTDVTLRDYEQADICLSLLLGDQEYKSSIDLWNYIYQEFIEFKDEQPIEYDRQGNPMPVREDEEDSIPAYDLEQDAEYIYASFLQAYRMNLFEQQGKLHWFEFKALFKGLPNDTIMKRIIQIRLYEPSKQDSAEHKKNMKDLQKYYALRGYEKDEEVY